MEEIRNKVAESGLISLDLADFKPNKNQLKTIDVADYLWQGLVLKEKEFRTAMQELDWSQFSNSYVHVMCSADAIVPTWAYMLIASKLHDNCTLYVIGSKQELERAIIQKNVQAFNPDDPENESKRYIIKGCADIQDPAFAMTELMKIIQPTAKSIMYGEPCSTVPIYKRK
jgi:hypothetical protein